MEQQAAVFKAILAVQKHRKVCFGDGWTTPPSLSACGPPCSTGSLGFKFQVPKVPIQGTGYA
eukprot:11818715-Prorocentrum_lima.AAC.1